MKAQFDFEQYKQQAVEDLLSGRKEIGGPNGVLAPLLKQFLEAALEAEVTSHVKRSKESGAANRRNGLMPKEVRSLSGVTRSHAFTLGSQAGHLSEGVTRSHTLTTANISTQAAMVKVERSARVRA